MGKVAELLGSPEFWFANVVVALVVNLITEPIRRTRFSPIWFSYFGIASAAFPAFLMLSGRSSLMGNWVDDLGWSIVICTFYIAIAFWPFWSLRLFSIFAPHAVVAALALRGHNLPDLGSLILAIYPAVYIFVLDIALVWMLFSLPWLRDHIRREGAARSPMDT